MLRPISVVLLALTIAAAGASAQQPGEVTGVLRDAGSGEPIAGASVTATTEIRRGVTNAAGRVLFVGVTPARYRLRVNSLAYGSTVTEAFTVEPSDRHDLGTI